MLSLNRCLNMNIHIDRPIKPKSKRFPLDLNPIIYVGGIKLIINRYTDDKKNEINHMEAIDYCQARGSRLVEIKTAEIQTALSNKLNKM